MIVLGIETSCDECSVALVRDGKEVLGQEIASQIDDHKIYEGVVPEIASRKHAEWILPLYRKTVKEAGIATREIDGIGVTNRPGLSGSLLVGLSFAKGLSISLGIPFIGVNHVLAHLYAPHLSSEISYPYIGLLISGGHTVIGIVKSYDSMEVLGTTIDDACGEAFDKVAKHFGFGYPGGLVIDRLARRGNPDAFHFPDPSLHKGEHRYDVSYSGLKTAVINQLDQFADPRFEKSNENIAASFEKAAIDILLKRLFKAVNNTGIDRVVVGGGVAANSYLRKRLTESELIEVMLPPMQLCTDNAAMIAGLGYHYLKRGECSGLDLNVSARVKSFRRHYP